MNHGNSLGDAQTPAAGDAGDQLPVASAETATPDLKRRLLLRGAVGMAPVVLTLRSGAVAASSCTGAVLITSLDSSSQYNPGAAPVNTSDICARITSQAGCLDTTHQVKTVNPLDAGVTTSPASGSLWQCNDGSGHPMAGSSNVAILSTSAASSLF